MLQLQLKKQERQHLNELTTKGKHNARVITRARTLLLLHEGKGEKGTAELMKINNSTVWRIVQRYNKQGVPACLFDKPRPGQVKYSEKDRANIIALACTKSPEGTLRWSLQLMVEELHKRGLITNHESIRLILKKAKQSLG